MKSERQEIVRGLWVGVVTLKMSEPLSWGFRTEVVIQSERRIVVFKLWVDKAVIVPKKNVYLVEKTAQLPL